MSAQPKRKIILKNLKEHNTIWHPQSTLVYKSKKERVVIGRFVDGELIPLDDIAVELCDEWRMKPDESLLENDDEASTHDSKDDGEDDSSTLSNSINDHITAVQNFCTVIQNRETNLQILLSKSMGRTSELEEKLAAAARERQEIEDELDVLKKKFKAMKSLFS